MASLRGGSGKQRAEAIVLNTLWGIREIIVEEVQVNKEQRP